MKKIVLFFISIFWLGNLSSQNWDSVQGGKVTQQIKRVLYDSVHNELIVSSNFLENINGKYVRGVCRWNGTRWDSLAGGINTHDILNTTPSGAVLSCIPYNGQTLFGGYFHSIGNVNANGIALWDGIKWDSLPKRAFKFEKNTIVSGFLKKNGLLYIHGTFDTIAGQPANGLATWDGVNYNPIPLPISSSFQGILDMVNFQNDLYITGGRFNIGASSNVRDVLKFNGSSWISTTAGGLLGSFSSIADLEIYNNELYACGHFTKSDGNVANHIMKWDGSQWNDIGFEDQPYFIAINKMQVYDNKLWVFGSFDKAAGYFASKVAVYDGANWCGLKDTLDNNLGTATVYKDTIYIGGGFWTVNSDSISYLAKLKNATLFNQCVSVGVNELSNGNLISIYPNPTNSILNIIDEQNALIGSTIDMKNSLGQVVYSKPFSNQIDISNLPSGIYFLSIQNKTLKIIKE